MSTKNSLMTKTDLARLFQVSSTTIGNWINRGCPSRKQPGKEVASAYQFDLNEVIEWRRKQEAAGRPQGGRPLERLPESAWERPEFENRLRNLAESAVRTYIWTWAHSREGMQVLLGLLLDENGRDKRQAAREAALVYLSLMGAFTDWLREDALDAALRKHGASLDDLWHQFTGERVTTMAPKNPDEIGLHIPKHLCVPPDEFVEKYWPDDPGQAEHTDAPG